jgi:hypothetical protein
MFTKYIFKQKNIYFTLLLGVTILLLAACDSGNNSQSGSAAQPTSAVVNSASAIIRHSPSGTVELMWDHASHVMTVHMALTGLTPQSAHPARISSGSCKNAGDVVYNLSPIQATAIGFADVITKVKDVSSGIPETGWHVDVSNGPGTTTSDQSMVITCANVFNPTASTNSSQSVQATLDEAFAPNQSVSGTAVLNTNNNQLTVVVALKGLAPHSKHLAHLHMGSCASQGPIKYDLKPIIADAAGNASTTSVIPNVTSVPRNGWYVNIHLGSSDLKSQTSNDPVACGDITTLS